MKNITLINFTNLNNEEKQLVLSWRNNPYIKKWMYNDKIITLGNHLEYIQELKNSKDKLYFLVKEKDQYIGVIDFTEIDTKNSQSKFGLYTNISLRGKGKVLLNIIKEYAFNTLKLNKLIAEAFENNTKAIELYNKFNFTITNIKNVNKRKIICMELKKETPIKKKKILIVAAHPDDEVLGCFGTVAKLIKEGYEAYTLLLSKGKASRHDSKTTSNFKKEIHVINNEIKKANNTIGIKKVFTYDFPDNKFDSIDLLEIIQAIVEIKNLVKPDIIFTHFENDLNIDHQITYKAVLTATRPMPDECVKEIYSFEILSSTEWNYPLSFQPDTYFDITNTLKLKQKAMKKYKSELCEFPHPRSLKGIKLNAQYQGMRLGKKYLEVFKSIRVIK